MKATEKSGVEKMDNMHAKLYLCLKLYTLSVNPCMLP